jgi:hypothetical protein
LDIFLWGLALLLYRNVIYCAIPSEKKKEDENNANQNLTTIIDLKVQKLICQNTDLSK